MSFIKNFDRNLNFFTFLFILIPFSYILGNLATNILGLLIILASIFKYKKEVFTPNNKILIFFAIFFLLVIISTIIDYYQNPESASLEKSFLYLRYLILLIAICPIIKNGDLNFKYFFLSCLVCSVFLSLDVIFQSIVGKDLFGFVSPKTHNSGFLGEELIAGGYIQKFLFLGLFSIPLLTKKISKFNLLVFLFLLIGFAGIVLSGNRMSVILFFIFIIFSIYLVRKFKYEFSLALIISPIIYILIFNLNSNIQSSHNSFFVNFKKLLPDISSELKKEYPELESNKGNVFYRQYKYKEKVGYEILPFGSGHSVLYITAIDTWSDSPIIGSGIRSFRHKCKNKMHLPNRGCEMHPHNYYLDILNSVGMLGLLFILSTFYFIFKNRFSLKRKIKEGKNYFIFNSIFLCLLVEFFPFKSSGSFFSTDNSFYIFVLFGLIINLKYSKK